MDIARPRRRDGKSVHVGQLSTHSERDNLHQNEHSHKTIRQASEVLVAQDVEISALRDQLRAVQSLEAETQEILEDLETVCKRSQDLEGRTQQHQDQSRAEASLYHQLRDALERNQQWQAYERQREGCVKGLLARVTWLEEKLNRANEGLSRHKEAHSEEIRRRVQEMQEHYDKLLHSANVQRDQLREQVAAAQQHMTDVEWRCEAAQRQVEELEQRVEAERLQHRMSVQEERRRWGLTEEQLRGEAQDERAQAQELRAELQELKAEAQEERRRWGLREKQLREEAQDERAQAQELKAEAQEERRRWGLREKQLREEAQDERAQELKAEAQEERRRWGLKEEQLRAEAQEEKCGWGLKEQLLRAEAQELQCSLQLEARRAAQLRAEAQEEKRRWGLKEEQLRAQAQELRAEAELLRFEAQELRVESQELHSSLELEARRAAQLAQQVNVLQTSLQVNRDEDQRRITVLEKQLEISSKTVEDERRECQCLQKQLHTVLRNLQQRSNTQRVAQRSQKERQGASAAESDEARLHVVNRPKPSMRNAAASSLSPRAPDLLDETLLECPGCLALYPASQHAELLAHLERCVD